MTRSRLFEFCDTGTDVRLWLLFVLRLLVDRRDGSLLLDLTEDLRSGTMTTGIPPVFRTSRRALWLEMVLDVPVEA